MATERPNRGESNQSTKKATREITWGVPVTGAVVGEENFGEKKLLRPRMPHRFNIATRRGRVETEVDD